MNKKIEPLFVIGGEPVTAVGRSHVADSSPNAKEGLRLRRR